MSKKLVGIIILIIIILMVLSGSLFTVDEGEQALVTRLGQIKDNSQGQPQVMLPGLHVKTPFLDSVLYFDTRIQTLTIDKSRVVTAQKKDVLVDYYVKWRITNLASYFTSTSGDSAQAEQLLTQQINGALRAQFGQRDIPDVVSDARSEIMSALSKSANVGAASLGIQVIDVRIKAIDLPDEVSSAVFNRMRAERTRVAAQHRSEGQAQAEAIQATADADATVIVAKANEQAAQLMAEGDKEAGKIYTQAYSKDPNFYAFYKSLQAYRQSFSNSNNNILVLSPNSDFFKYFNNPSGNNK